MDLVLRQRQPLEGFSCLASGKFMFDCLETLCVVAAASCSVHLFGIEILGAEELIVPIVSLDVYGHIAHIACLPQSHADLVLVLLKTGELKVLRYQKERLQVVDSIQIFQDLTEDYASFLSVFDNGIIAAGSRFGRIGLVHFPVNAVVWQHNLPTSSIHSAPQCIDLLHEKDRQGNTIMPHGNERLVSLDLSTLPLDWPLPIQNTLRKKVLGTLWVGIENSQGSIADTTQGCTRVAAVSFPDPGYSSPGTDLDTALSSASVPLLHWYDGNLPNRSTPTPLSQPHGPAFLSLIESGISGKRTRTWSPDDQDKCEEYPQRISFYFYSTAAKCRLEKDTQNSDNDTSYDVVYYDDLRRLQLSSHADSESISSWYWELDNTFPSEDNFLVLATTAGKLYRISMAYLKDTNGKELAESRANPLNFGFRDIPIGWDEVEDIPPVSLHACGNVEGGIVAMTPLPGGRVICITDDHAVVLLRLDESTPGTKTSLANDVPDAGFVSHASTFSLVHCYQGAGSLVSCAKGYRDGAVMAVRGGSFERLREYSEAFKSLHAFDEEAGNVVVAMDVAEDKKESQGGKGEEMAEEVVAAVGEDISVGGASTYGAPGALVTIHPDTLLEKMFEGKAGDGLAVTGLWPLKRNERDKHHAAVLLASTGSARVLAVDGGGVFSDVTDSLQMISDKETLAAGSMHISDWVSQVIPTHVRAFHLDPTCTASLDWYPPVGSTITSSVVSNGFIILQCLSNAQHSLLVLHLKGSDTSVEFMQLGEPYLLSQEASCIGDWIQVSADTHAVLIIGTYRPSIVILELSIINAVSFKVPHQTWRLLGEISLAGDTISDDDNVSSNVPASPPFSPPPSSLSAPASTPEKRLQPDEYDIGAEVAQQLEWDRAKTEWPSGSPLAAAARDHRKPHPLRKTTGTTIPSSIAVAPAAGMNDLETRGLEIWVSSRSGDVLRLQTGGLTLLGKEGVTLQNNGACISKCSFPYGELPPTLVILPQLKRVSPSFKVLAVSDRASLLRASPNCGAIDELRLHTPGVSCAAPLVLELPGGGDRLFLFAASTDGALSLFSLEAHQRSKVSARPLPWRPDLIATNEKLYGAGVPGVVAVAGRKWHHHTSEDGQKEDEFSLPYVELFDSTTGQSLNNFGGRIVLIPGETITGLAILPWNFWENVREYWMKHVPGWADENLETNAGADQKYRCFILASSILDTTQHFHNPGDAQGRLLFFACPLHVGERFWLLETLYFPDPVYAVEFSDYDADPYRAIAVIATGRRIASYSVNLDPSVGGYLVKDASMFINSPANRIDFNGKNICAACVEGELNLLLYYMGNDVPGSVSAVFQVRSFPPEVFDCIDARSCQGLTELLRNPQLSVDSSGIIRAFFSEFGRMDKGHCGDANPLGLAEALNAQLQDKEVLVITRGGGVVEVHCLQLVSKGLLLALQRAIVECPRLKIETASVKNFLGLYRRPEFYKHPKPLNDIEGMNEGPERVATTAEGPAPAAITPEPALKDFLSSLEDFSRMENAENVIYNSHQSSEMLHLSVLRLFLDSHTELQRELLVTAIENVGGDQDGDVEIDTLVYELSEIGAHSMF